MHISPLFALLLSASAVATSAFADDDTAQLGQIDFPVTCNADGQSAVTEGVLLLHHMMYHQAEERFRAATVADPACAMAEWGVAMTQFHPIWPRGQSDEALAKGLAAIDRLATIQPPAPREAGYIAAARVFYDEADAPYPERLKSWAEAQQALTVDYPDDIDAGALAALAILAVAPTGDQSLAAQRKAGELLETLHEQAPDHPGIFHYVIHAYDHPLLAENAARFAESYDRMAPKVPHALHMPSHIVVRLGKWPEVAAWNRRAATAALDQPLADGVTSGHFAHAQDYLIYALLQMGENEAAAAEVAALLGRAKIEDDFVAAYALSGAPARAALESRNWAAAAALSPPSHSSINWDRFPQAQAITWHAKGSGCRNVERRTRGAGCAARTRGLARRNG